MGGEGRRKEGGRVASGSHVTWLGVLKTRDWTPELLAGLLERLGGNSGSFQEGFGGHFFWK